MTPAPRSSPDPTRRFTSRAEHYAKHRPGYPAAVLELLARECGLTPASVVADVGSGTGIFTEMLLENGNRVFAVEPNPEMRQAAERLLAAYPGFTSVEGAAEATGLPAASADVVTAAQAFHWFDRERTRAELQRILKPGGRVALLWNDRDAEATPFAREYERLLRAHGKDYTTLRHRDFTPEDFGSFFGTGRVATSAFPNAQSLDLDALIRRTLSASYMPLEDEPGHEALRRELCLAFERFAVQGRITLEYATRVFHGRI